MRVGITRGLGARAYFEAGPGQGRTTIELCSWLLVDMGCQRNVWTVFASLKANLGCEVRKLERGWNNPTGLGASDCKTEASRRHATYELIQGIYETAKKQSQFNDSLC